jgi:hypothetical protein
VIDAELNKDEPQQAVKIIRSAHFLFSRFGVLFADGIFNFKDRQDGRAEFSSKDAHWAFKVVEIKLSFMYDRLYTKASVSRTMSGLLVRVSSLLMTLAGSIWALFMMLQHASRYQVRHRCVTYSRTRCSLALLLQTSPHLPCTVSLSGLCGTAVGWNGALIDW